MNIYDIAELAGVSIATVSRVVNDSPKVSEKTKEKVRRIMEEHQGYIKAASIPGKETIFTICFPAVDQHEKV